MAAYVIYRQRAVADPDSRKEYRAKIRDLLAGFGARVVAADPEPGVLEGDWTGTRCVIIEFPDTAVVDRRHHSAEYKPLLELRQAAASGSVIAVKGV